MKVSELNKTKLITVKDKVKTFFRRNKDKAYRICEVEKKLKDLKKRAIWGGVRKLYLEGFLLKKSYSSNKSFYFWNKKKQAETKKLKEIWDKSWGKPLKKVNFKLKVKK